MNKNKEYQIYELVMLGVILTSQTLKDYAFSDEDIDKLISDKIIAKSREGVYELLAIDGMYQYGVKLLVNFQRMRGNTCFYKCHKLDPNHRKAYMQIFLSHLKKCEYYKIVNDFIGIDNIEDEDNKKNNMLYLYLLNMITTVPVEYQERISNVDIEDIVNFNETENEKNIICYAILHNKFTYALKLLNDMIAKNPVYDVENEVLKELLIQVVNIEKEFKIGLYFNAVREEYQKIIAGIETKAKKRYLKTDEAYILITARAIVKALETKTIPVASVNRTRSLYQALSGNNFPLALELNNKFMKKVDMKAKTETLDILLQKMNSIITELSKSEVSEYIAQEESNPLVRKRTID